MGKRKVFTRFLWTILAGVAIGVSLRSEAADPSPVCTTDICKETAQIFRAAIDPTVHPCKNFYKFACGRYLERTPIPRGRNMVGPFYQAFETQHAHIRDILSQTSTEPKSSAQSKAIQFYKSCVDSVSNLSKRTESMNTLKEMLSDLINGWPLTTRNWSPQGFDLTTSLAKITSRLDQSFYVSPLILPDMGNSSKYTLTLLPQSPSRSAVPFLSFVMKTTDQIRQDPITGLPPVMGSQNYQMPTGLAGIIREVVCTIDPQCNRNPNLYNDIMTLNGMLTMGGYSINNAELFNTERTNMWLKNLYSSTEPELEELRLTIPQLNQALPEIEWKKYFSILFEDTDFRVDDNFRVLALFEQLSQLLDGLGELEDRSLALLLGWHIVVKYGKIFSPQIRAILATGEDQSDVCIGTVNGMMGYAVANMYNQKHIPEASMNEVKNIVADLRISFRKLLESNAWMDSTTKAAALKKAAAMGESVAAPDWILDQTKLDQYYSKLTSDDVGNFTSAFKMAKSLAFQRQIQRLRQPVYRKDDWPIETPAMTNAMYYLPTNFMYFGSGMLQYPFYMYGRPRAVNFGSFGYIAGHEITHGFDTAGSTRNEFGELKNWWMMKSAQEFQSRAQCFVNQYSSMVEPTTGMRLNGMQTIGEDIADNGGIRAAFLAYKNVSNAEGGRLYGLEQYTEDQLFFLSAALTYCSRATPQYMQMLIMSDEHSPNMFRAILPLLNSDDFSKAFNCPVNTAMNPKKKCRVW